MSNTYNTELQAQVKTFLATSGLSQAEAAPKIGLNKTVLSLWLRSIYEGGNIENTENKIIEFFRLNQEQTAAAEKALPLKSAGGYIPTSISEDVCRLIQYCHFEKGMVVVHGDAGIGKTKGAERYVRENPTSTIYIEATPSSGTLSNILRLLARALRIPESRSKLDLMLEIRDKLESANKVIVIDEAQHLKYSALEEIRTLSEANLITDKTGTGIVLIGNTEVYDRMVGKQEARFAQQFSRIRMNRYYSTSRVTVEDVKLLFPALDGKSKELTFLHGISQSKWGIRGAVNVYNNAVNNESITYDGLFSMARGMGIGVLG